MWTFQVKPSTLLVMMATVVLVLSVAKHMPNPCEKLQHDMKVEVKSLSNAKWRNIRVPKPTNDLKTCPKNFFCLAEKVLESIVVEPEKTIFSKLTNILEIYNNKTCSSNCTLKTDQVYHLQRFLKDVETCLNYTLLPKSME